MKKLLLILSLGTGSLYADLPYQQHIYGMRELQDLCEKHAHKKINAKNIQRIKKEAGELFKDPEMVKATQSFVELVLEDYKKPRENKFETKEEVEQAAEYYQKKVDVYAIKAIVTKYISTCLKKQSEKKYGYETADAYCKAESVRFVAELLTLLQDQEMEQPGWEAKRKVLDSMEALNKEKQTE